MRRNLKLVWGTLTAILSVALLAASVPLSLVGTGTARADVFTSELTIRWNEEKTLFKGKVKSDSPDCLPDRRVRVFKKRPGKDKKIGSDLTNNKGRWKVDKRHANGRYYAKVAASQLSGYYGPGDTCGKARSKTIKV